MGQTSQSCIRAAFTLLCGLVLAGCTWFSSGQTSRPVVVTPEPWSPEPGDPPEASPADVPTMLSRAESLLKRDKSDEALFYLVKVLDIEPRNVRALLDVGAIHRSKGNYDLAELAYELVLKQQPGDAEALEGMGLTRLAEKSDHEAEKYLSDAVKADPKRWRSHNALGLLASRSGHYVQAINHYEQALREQPRNAECLNNLGYAKYQSRDWAGALSAYDEALAIEPKYETAWMNKGLLLARQGDERAALAALGQVMNEADAYNDLGYIYMQQGDLDAAYELFEKAVATSPAFHVKANENLRRLKLGAFNHSGASR